MGAGNACEVKTVSILMHTEVRHLEDMTEPQQV